VGDDGTMLPAWLDYQRATLLWKCELLEGDALVRRSVPPSPLSIDTSQDHDADWHDLDPARAMEDIERFQRQCDISREIVAVSQGMDQLVARPWRGVSMSLRWITVHMIEEYARHNGHADLLRELVDGAVGE
jgi:hypothetical protein